MLKLSVFAVFCMVLVGISAQTANSETGIGDEQIWFRAREATQWAVERVSRYTGATGTHTLGRINKILYNRRGSDAMDFIIEADVTVNNQKYVCELRIADSPVVNARSFTTQPKCTRG